MGKNKLKKEKFGIIDVFLKLVFIPRVVTSLLTVFNAVKAYFNEWAITFSHNVFQ